MPKKEKTLGAAIKYAKKPHIIELFAGATNPSDTGAKVYYGGSAFTAMSETATQYGFYAPITGKITKAVLTVNATAGTAEATTVALRVDDTTDYEITAALNTSVVNAPYLKTFAAPISVIEGVTALRIKWSVGNAVWATNPTAVYMRLALYVVEN